MEAEAESFGFGAMEMESSRPKFKKAVATVEEQTLSTEFTIARPTTVLSSNESTKVTRIQGNLNVLRSPSAFSSSIPNSSANAFLLEIVPSF